MIEYTENEIREIIADWGDAAPQVLETVNLWLARGDGVAVYENQDLGHPEGGERRLMSYGSEKAQVESDVPPERMPDIGHQINWRYVLVGCYRSDPLKVPLHWGEK